MYGKFFAQTFTGSMMAAGPEVFAVWAYVIANANGGEVELNPRLLAAVIGSTPDRMKKAIETLCAPDPESRSKAEDGKRLLKIGEYVYRVVNHAEYRAMRNDDERREYFRTKKREQRQRDSEKSNGASKTVKDKSKKSPPSTHTEAETENKKESTSAAPTGRTTIREQVVALYHDKLPMLPAVKVLNAKRERAVKKFWDFAITRHPEPAKAPAILEWIGAYFDRAARSPWINGTDPAAGDWKADFDYVISEKAWTRVIEKTA